MAQQKTYWHLLAQRRMPSEYELVTSKLHCHTGEGFTGKGFELDVPVNQWYDRYQRGSPFASSAWEKFQDPRATTYTKYTDLQRSKEIVVDGLFEEIEATDYDRALSRDWVETLGRALAPLRYPFHGLQMIAAYVGQMGPSGKITIAGAFQAADEMRRVQRIAYRVRLLQLVHQGFAEDSRALWQEAPMWQPLRRVIEHLLVTYDWGEAFVALNLVLKPLIDELFMHHLGRRACVDGDYLLGRVFFSLNQDCAWHRQWSQALVEAAIANTGDNRRVVERWVEKWFPAAEQAVIAFASVFEGAGRQGNASQFDDVLHQIGEHYQNYLAGMGLQKPTDSAGLWKR